MTNISLTSGEILDIMSALEVQEDKAYFVKNDPQLSVYYLHMIQQFQMIYDKLQELPGEKRVANLVLTVN
jgi:hypothetical protein